MSLAMINSDVKPTIEAELRSGERLLWADKPSKFPLSFIAIYITGFSLVWTSMAISFVGVGFFASIVGPAAAETSAEATGVGAFGIMLSVISLLFVCVGIGMILWGLKMLVGPSREIYAITDQRGIIVSPFIKYRIVSLSSEALANSERKGRPEMGTLTFKSQTNGWMSLMMNPYQTELAAFQNINNPEKVEDLIHTTFFRRPTS